MLSVPNANGARSAHQGALPMAFLQRNRFLLTFAALSVLMGSSVGMAQVAVSLYAVELGSSKGMLALIAGAQSIGVLVMSLPVGILVDRYGPARPFLTGTLLAGLTYAVVPVWHGPWALLLCTALISFFMPLRFVSLNTLFLQQLASLGEGKAGWYRGTHMVGMFLLGPALGARAIASLGFVWTYRLIALAFLLTILVSPIVFAPYARLPEGKLALSWAAVREQLRLLVRDRELCAISAIEASTQAIGAFFTFFVVVLAVSAAGLGPSQASSLVGAKGATYIIALFLLGGVVARLGPSRAYALSFATIAVGLGLLGIAHASMLLWVGSLVLGLGLGTVQIATLTRYAQIGERTGHGKVSGLNALVGPSGGVLGSLLGGVIGAWLGLQKVFLLAAFAFALALFLMFRKTAHGRRLRAQKPKLV